MLIIASYQCIGLNSVVHALLPLREKSRVHSIPLSYTYDYLIAYNNQVITFKNKEPIKAIWCK